MMDDLTDRRTQIDVVLSGSYAGMNDEELNDYEEDMVQSRSWWDVEYIYAEHEYREEAKRTLISRDDWARREIAKIERVF